MRRQVFKQRLQENYEEAVVQNENITVYEDQVEFEKGADKVLVTGSEDRLTSKHILIASGGNRYGPPSFKGLELCLTVDALFWLNQSSLPKSLIVLGGTQAGIEVAQLM